MINEIIQKNPNRIEKDLKEIEDIQFFNIDEDKYSEDKVILRNNIPNILY